LGGDAIRLIDLEADETGVEELGEEQVAGHGGAATPTVLAAADFDEGLAEMREHGEGDREPLNLNGVPPVLEGVHVAFGRPGAGSSAASRHVRLLSACQQMGERING
jgi:hypothetical protein